MRRLSETLFMVAIIIIYFPKLFKIKTINYVKVHITLGLISIIAMIIAFLQRIGSSEFFRYIGYVVIIILIGVTGYLYKKNRKFKIYHISTTISFFVYLLIAINFLK